MLAAGSKKPLVSCQRRWLHLRLLGEVAVPLGGW